jgi:hypothetical protein
MRFARLLLGLARLSTTVGASSSIAYSEPEPFSMKTMPSRRRCCAAAPERRL